jgi:hypothetical protein
LLTRLKGCYFLACSTFEIHAEPKNRNNSQPLPNIIVVLFAACRNGKKILPRTSVAERLSSCMA